MTFRLTLLTLSFCLTRGDVLETGELPFLGTNLKPQECWALGNFLAQKSWDPFEASAEMTKSGGHSSEFKCLPALDFWAKELLPQSIQKMGKGQFYGEEILDKGLRFVNRADLVDSIQKMRPAKGPDVLDIDSDEEDVDVLEEGENTLGKKPEPGHPGQPPLEELSLTSTKGTRRHSTVDKGQVQGFQNKVFDAQVHGQGRGQVPHEHVRVQTIGPPNPTPGRVALGLIIGFIAILLLVLVVAAIHSCLRARREVDVEGVLDVTSDQSLDISESRLEKGSNRSVILYDQTGSPVGLDPNANKANQNKQSPRP